LDFRLQAFKAIRAYWRKKDMVYAGGQGFEDFFHGFGWRPKYGNDTCDVEVVVKNKYLGKLNKRDEMPYPWT